MGNIISELIDEYIRINRTRINQIAEKSDLKDIMALSESSFMEWDNDEDEIYNDL